MPEPKSSVIIGGGIAGLSAAIALEKAGVHCTVIEKGDPPVGASMSLSGRATDALVELGIWDEVCRTGAPFTPQMAAAPIERDAAGIPLGPALPPPSRPGGAPSVSPPRLPVGVFRPQFARELDHAARQAGVDIRRNVTVTELENGASGVRVVTSDGGALSADFAVVADGIWSQTRKRIFPDAPEPEYAGQMSIRWMFDSAPMEGEAWYVAERLGRVGFFHFPYQGMMYVPMVLNMPERHLDQAGAYEAAKQLLDAFTAPAIVGLRDHLRPDATLIARPFQWMLLPQPWHAGRVLLIGDAAHATTAHMGMGAGMALEDGVVLAQCIAAAASVDDAFATFNARRAERVRTVVETSLALSRLEQEGAPPSESAKLRGAAFGKIAAPY